MCHMGRCEDYCASCDDLRDTTRRFVVRCKKAEKAGKVCCPLGPIDEKLVERGQTLCAACYAWIYKSD